MASCLTTDRYLCSIEQLRRRWRICISTNRTKLLEPPLTINTLATWHELVQSRNVKGLASLLADNCIFYSPVVHTPQVGKAVTGPNDAVLEFQVEIDGIAVNGVDMIKWADDGRIVEFKVMIRPLKAINLIHQKMAAMLQVNQ